MLLKIIYIDDESALCENFKDLYSSEDVEVETFTNTESAIEKILESPPDVLFIDYRLPGTTGEQVATVLNLDIPIVLVTGELEVKTTYPFYRIIQKSVDYEEVSRTIAGFLKQRRSKVA